MGNFKSEARTFLSFQAYETPRTAWRRLTAARPLVIENIFDISIWTLKEASSNCIFLVAIKRFSVVFELA
jgi:hypothetical protein